MSNAVDTSSVYPAPDEQGEATGNRAAATRAELLGRAPAWLVKSVTAAWLLVALLWCGIPLSPSMTDGDFWGHVQYGRDTLTHGLDRTATYTYTAVGHRWINHENLSEIIFAGVSDHWGTGALLGIKCSLGLSVLCVAGLRRQVSPALLAAAWILVAVNLSYYWATRPQIFSFTFFAWMIAGLDWVFAAWSQEFSWRSWFSRSVAQAEWQRVERSGAASSRRLAWLVLLPVLMIVWTNTHGGFVAGAAVASLLLSGRLWQARYAPRRVQLILLAVLSVTLLATLATPYGWQLPAWLFGSVFNPRPEVPEWLPPELFRADSVKLWCLLIAVTVGWWGTRQRVDWLHIAVITVVLWQAIEHRRHIPFLAILGLMWLLEHWQSTIDGCWQAWRDACRNPQSSATLSSTPATGEAEPLCERAAAEESVVTPAAVGAWLGIGTAVVLSGWLTQTLWLRVESLQVDRAVFPVAAVQFIAQEQLRGRCLVTAQWAQFVLSSVGGRDSSQPGLQVAFDGRYDTCYPQEVIDFYFDFERGPGGPDARWRGPSSPPSDARRMLSLGNPTYVLVGRRRAHARGVLAAAGNEWSLLYQDSTAELWGRASEVDDPASATYFSPERRRLTGVPAQSGRVPWHVTQRAQIASAILP